MRELSAGLRRFVDDQSGATAIEYGLIAALVAVGAILAMTVFGGNLSGMFNTVSTRAGDAMANAGT
jgi:pilus assembly protein Flp/PilA